MPALNNLQSKNISIWLKLILMAKTINWHKIVQNILEQHLSLLSGKVVAAGSREHHNMIRVDFFCHVKGDIPKEKLKPIMRPFNHLKERNLIEYKSMHDVVNEKMFRHYVSRALYMETCEKLPYQGKTTLTIFTTRRPTALINKKRYSITPVNEWKYQSRWIKDLDVFIIVQKDMRGVKGGEALALLQILEGEKGKQIACWEKLFAQDLNNIDVLQNIAKQINKEKIMNLVEELKKEGIKIGEKKGEKKGEIKTFLRILSRKSPELAKKYERKIKSSIKKGELEKAEEEMINEIYKGGNGK